MSSVTWVPDHIVFDCNARCSIVCIDGWLLARCAHVTRHDLVGVEIEEVGEYAMTALAEVSRAPVDGACADSYVYVCS